MPVVEALDLDVAPAFRWPTRLQKLPQTDPRPTDNPHRRFILLVPVLRELLEVPIPADRGPGRPWQELPRSATTGEPTPVGPPIRIGYARCSAAKGNHGRRPRVIDDDMITFALAVRAKGVPVPEIAQKLTISSGKNAGKHPSVASLYRALAAVNTRAGPPGSFESCTATLPVPYHTIR